MYIYDLADLVGYFLGLAIPGAILLAALWGIFILIRRGYRRVMTELTKNNAEVNGKRKLTYEQKEGILNIIKLIVGSQLIGVLFYITPAINENIKIIVSLLITLGSFVATFFIKEKKGYNGICRALIFIGQEFFGITMILMMVNKGMGYSINVVFAIWTVFNYYIGKQFKKIENKIFFWITFIILICSMIYTYSNVAQLNILVIGICAVLLAIYFFGNKSKISTRLMNNVFLTILLITFLGILGMTTDTSLNIGVINSSIAIYMVTIVIASVVKGEFNPRALSVYIPYIVFLFIGDLEINFVYMFTLFNILFVIELLSDKSIYKKILCSIGLVWAAVMAIGSTTIDPLNTIILYTAAVIISFTYIFAPARPKNLKKGGETDEE